jgi:hypothetical protein
MVWGDDMVLKNEYLIDGSYSIALTMVECSCLALESLMDLLSFHPAEAAMVKRYANKLTLIRGIRKIAVEVRARHRGIMSKNEYARSLISKFEKKEITGSGRVGFMPYSQGDNVELDSALHGLSGSAYGAAGKQISSVGSAFSGAFIGGCHEHGGGGGQRATLVELAGQLSALSRESEERIAILGDQNQAAINEIRHVTRVFNDVVLSQQGLVSLFRGQVGTTLASFSAKSQGKGSRSFLHEHPRMGRPENQAEASPLASPQLPIKGKLHST